MSKIIALLPVVFLIALCLVVDRPVFASADTVEDSWTSKTPMQVAFSSP